MRRTGCPWCTLYLRAGYQAEQAAPDGELIRQAVETALQADVIFACVGLPDSFESEGFDRTHMQLPDSQNALMAALGRNRQAGSGSAEHRQRGDSAHGGIRWTAFC